MAGDDFLAATETAELVAPWRIGVDVGGTFTDLVLIDACGEICEFKAPSNPSDPAEGVFGVLEIAAQGLGLSTTQLLQRCGQFIHGTTIATNTILERKGSTVGLLTTAGFRDTLEIRRGFSSNMWDHRSAWPEVMVPRKLRRPIVERVDKTGRPKVPLEAESVSSAIELFRRSGVEAIAICFLNSYQNDCHERECQAMIGEMWPEIWVGRSSEIAPIIGEYERASSTVVSTYLAPKVIPYLRQLDAQLRDRGLRNRLLLVQSNGGAVSIDQIETRPHNLVLSGPAAGVGALQFFSDVSGSPDLISIEIGGTSCDVTLMREGRVAETDRISIEGYHVSLPAVEIHTVGAGGGTIAGVDAGGMMFAGPGGAGARPGPACYGFGGLDPTVTDSQLVLGRLKSGSYAGGIIELDEGKASDAIERRLAETAWCRCYCRCRWRHPTSRAEHPPCCGAREHRAWP